VANDAENAICALRESTEALRKATDRRAVRDSGIDRAELIAELAINLEALAPLVRSTGLEPIPTTPASHNLQAVVQGVTATAVMARRIAIPDGYHLAPHLAAGRWSGATGDD
jgi:hypothetical protein